MGEGDGGGEVTSPCNRICTIDQASGLCRGCLRTIEEIRDWSRMSPGERRALVAALAGRSLEAGA
jgi:uncharacterized protein